MRIAESSPEGLSYVTQGFSPDNSAFRTPHSAIYNLGVSHALYTMV